LLADGVTVGLLAGLVIDGFDEIEFAYALSAPVGAGGRSSLGIELN
jgi:hypothetical protein